MRGKALGGVMGVCTVGLDVGITGVEVPGLKALKYLLLRSVILPLPSTRSHVMS